MNSKDLISKSKLLQKINTEALYFVDGIGRKYIDLALLNQIINNMDEAQYDFLCDGCVDEHASPFDGECVNCFRFNLSCSDLYREQ